jgi:hypothetical protein
MQRMGLALGAPLGRLAGYGATYVPVQAVADDRVVAAAESPTG